MAENSDITSVPPPPDPPDPSPNPIQPLLATSTTMAGATEQLSSSPNSSSSTPPWIIWSRGLNALLDDPQGQELFKTYLEEEDCYLQLSFLWACEGLKCTAINDPPKIPDLVKKIYRAFIPNLIGLSDTTRSTIAQAIVDGRFSEIEIFHAAEDEVLTNMKEHLYPNFLKSEMYLSACNGEDTFSSGSGSGRERRQSDESVASVGDEEASDHIRLSHSQSPPQGAIGIDPLSPVMGSPSSSNPPSVQHILLTNQLQTVHEDKELSTATASASTSQVSHSKSKKHFGLTKEALLATEFHRATEFQKGRKGDNGGSSGQSANRYFVKHVPVPTAPVPFPYHASYSSYNPVSRVDSEIQSMSSDAMTDISDASGSRIRHNVHSRDQRRHEDRQSSHRTGSGQGRSVGHNAGLMQPHAHLVNPQNPRKIPGVPTDAPLNTADDLKKLPTQGQIFNKSRLPGPDPEKDPAGFAGIITDKLNYIIEQRTNAHSCKDILAQAISKIQIREEESPSDIIDMHFARVTYLSDVTPNKSPKLRSPTIGRRKGPLPPAPPTYPVPNTRRRGDRDFVQSTFSVDSGNVPDSESLAMQDNESRVMQLPKSRSVPHELRGQQEFRRPPPMPFGANPRGYHHQPRGFLGKVPLGMFKKPTSTEFIDSGISTVSGQSTNIMPPPSSTQYQQYQASGCGGEGQFPDRRIQDWVAQSHSDSVGLSMGYQQQRRMRKPIPPELEDVREKLAQTLDLHSSSSSRSGGHLQFTAGVPRLSPPSSGSETVTETMNGNYVNTIVNYDDNEGPYLLKIPKMYGMSGSGVTLAALKERLPRQGQFRFFFRTECLELESKVVQEEVYENHHELPMLNGKIVAHLKAIPGPSGMPSSQI